MRSYRKRRGSISYRHMAFEVKFFLGNVIIALLLCTLVISILNARVVTISAPVKTEISPFKSTIVTNIPKTATNADYSFDNQYCSYIDGGVLYIKKINVVSPIKVIAEPKEVNYALMVNDTDIVMYLYIDSLSKTHIATYNITLQKTQEYRTFPVARGSTIKSVKYAINTNLVYVVVEGKSNHDTIFRINAENKILQYPMDYQVSDIEPSVASLNVYHQTSDYKIYYNTSPAAITIGLHLKMIGRDKLDHFYFLSQDVLNRIMVYDATGLVRSFAIPSGVMQFYSNYNIVYAIYDGFVIDLTSPEHTPIQFDNNYRFSGIVNGTMYLLQK